jgi:hypothetical protein
MKKKRPLRAGERIKAGDEYLPKGCRRCRTGWLPVTDTQVVLRELISEAEMYKMMKGN